jgi:CDGSH iron-sulfur domain-containing protein 3
MEAKNEPPVEVVVRESGPYRIYGPIRVVDADGNPYDLDRKRIPDGGFIALCRCGGSSTKPFCDGTHKRNGFTACERVSDPAWKTGPGGPATK